VTDAAIGGTAAQETTARRAWWKGDLAPYARPSLRRSALDLLTSVVPYLALMVAMYLLLDVSYWLVLAVSIPAAGFLVRVFIVFHDCAHGSFLPGKRANTVCGIAMSFFVWGTFHTWRHSHAVHHGTAGDLDRRGTGDLPTMTSAEYANASWRVKLGYSLFRNPVVMFGLGPIWSMIVQPRLWFVQKRPRLRRAALLNNIALAAVVTGLCLLIGPGEYFLIFAPAAWMAGAAGVFLFYVQHQFEDVYWRDGEEWSYAEAALRGSSYLRLPKVLQFFSGNIGFHHVHHLSARIPNYNLPRAHAENPMFHDVPTLSLWDGLRATRLKLWDEERGKLVTFAQARS
jgi:omega-6 fatty acid desaturase (delta-12 desaturase)